MYLKRTSSKLQYHDQELPTNSSLLLSYASEKDADEHMTTEHFQTLMKTAGGEEVLSKPPTIIKCQPFAGFLSR